MATREIDLRRRHWLAGAAAIAGCSVMGGSVLAQNPQPTPACGAGATPRQTEGPYFKPASPERADLMEASMAGPALAVSGRVLTRDCRPVPRALIEIWQADAGGEYDNRGFRLRGHVFTTPDGRYRFRTVVPGAYPGRTPHIHVKVQAPNRPVLTTQLYFPGDPGNARDRLFRPELLLGMADAGTGAFDFVLDIA
ncbi:MAG: intradiol ring-cleavage dioxygenase [Pseudorhodoplanes sp.]